MALLNTSLWDSILPGAAETALDAGGVDVSEVIDQALWDLHAASRADLVFWTEAQLIQWLDEAVKRLASAACVFVGRFTATLTVQGQAGYSHPPQHVSTLHVSLNSTALRPAATLELEAKDPAYQTTQGTPAHWYEDLLGLGSLGLAPVPDTSDVTMPQIYEGWPAALDPGQTMVAAPAPLKGYLSMALLAEAYGIEGEMEAPDIAAHCRGRLDLYRALLQHYYGVGI
jgi:hypothetical protein